MLDNRKQEQAESSETRQQQNSNFNTPRAVAPASLCNAKRAKSIQISDLTERSEGRKPTFSCSMSHRKQRDSNLNHGYDKLLGTSVAFQWPQRPSTIRGADVDFQM